MDNVERTIQIIKYLALSRKNCGVSEISTQLKVSKSSVCRILSSLERLKWVTQLQDGKYLLGDNVLKFSLSVLSGVNFRTTSQNTLLELNSLTGETAVLNMRVGYEDICLDQVVSDKPVRHEVTLGVKFPIWSGATGKAILAHLPASEIDEVLDQLSRSGVTVLASGQRIEIDKLLLELDQVKKQGFAISIGERTPVTASVASPIFERGNRVIGTIQVTGPLPRFNEETARDYSKFVVQAARDISVRLQYSE